MATDLFRASDVFATTAKYAPITYERSVRDDLEMTLPKQYLARALIAPDTRYPMGTPGRNHSNLSVLQQHVSFFDKNGDGIVYPWETYAGCQAIGFNKLTSFLMTAIINLSMSAPTIPGWSHSLAFPIYLLNIHKANNGSDSGIYDTEGRFLPVNFENTFSKYARTIPDKFTFAEVWSMTDALRVTFDNVGGIFTKIEWGLLYVAAEDEMGFLSKEAVRGCFDGSLFEHLAEMNTKAKAN